MKTTWRIKDIIDLEYFLHEDESGLDETDESHRALEDREIFLNHIEPELKEKKSDKTTQRKFVIRKWLDVQRQRERDNSLSDIVLPGDMFDEFYRLFKLLFIFSSLFIGAVLAFSFLSYSGDQPLNVSVYLFLFVLPQLILLFPFILFPMIRLRGPRIKLPGLYSAIGSLFIKTSIKFKDKFLKRLSADKRSRFEIALGMVKGTRQVYGSIFFWPVFLLAQSFGIGFNLGIVSATLIRVLISDLAFGWQSTVQFSVPVVYQFVKIIASPWRWLIPPGISHPTLEQIEGSKMVLKEGIYHLATMDLVAWWPFLCFCVLFYGMIPRIIFAVIGVMAQTGTLRRIEFQQYACEKLMRRLMTPAVTTEGQPPGRQQPMPDSMSGPINGSSLPQNDELEVRPEKHFVSEEKLIALVHDDIFDDVSDESLSLHVQSISGHQIERKEKIGLSPKEDTGLIRALVSEPHKGGIPNILLLQEAWQPPIRETISYIKDLRSNLEDKTKIYLLLIGKPRGKTIFTPVAPEDYKIWQQAIKKIGDPFLYIERLG